VTFCGKLPLLEVTHVGYTAVAVVPSSVIAVVVADPADPVTLPFMAAVTVSPVSVPTDVMAGCAAPVTVTAVVADPALPVVF
jgi:hypothetical protein